MANFTISQNTGAGITVIQVTPSGQNLTYSARTSTITISDGTSTKNVLVKQTGLPHTVPALDVVNADSTQQNILFTVESDFTIQFSGYNPGNSWATIWDYDSGEQLDQYDHYDPDDLAHTTFALRLTQNRTGNDRQMTIYMKHIYNNAGELETAPYVYSINIFQAASSEYQEYLALPLTFRVLTGGTIMLRHNRTLASDVGDLTIQYRKNGGTWTNLTASTAGTTFNTNIGDVLEFKGDNAKYGSLPLSYTTFSGSTAIFEAYGNIMSLIDSTGYRTATTVSEQYCFNRLFSNTNITNAEHLMLPATTIAMHAYTSMFQNCTLLTKAPILPATLLTNSCYNEMFNGCSVLSWVKCLATDHSAYNCTYNWLSNVAATGTFIKASGITWSTGNSAIPNGWTVQEDSAPIAGLSIPYSISCAFEEGDELDAWLYVYDTQNQLIDAVELIMTEGNDYTGYIGNAQLTAGQSIRIMFWNGGGIEPVYTRMKYTGSWTSESALDIGDDMTITDTVTVGTTLYINLSAGEQ